VAWTPGTNGPISAPIVVAPIDEESDFDKWRGKLSGRIVLLSLPGTGSEPAEAAFKRYTAEDLTKLNTYPSPPYSPERINRSLKRDRTRFALALDQFLKQEGARAWVRMSYRDGGLVHGTGYTYKTGQTPALPGFEMAAEDYRKLTRLARTETAPTLELMSEVRFHDEDQNAYNIIADITGTGRTGEYVMAGAHLDSWVAADGAVDNAAGSGVVMEAARIIRSLGIRPKRTIRFALWSGEEQGLLGSLAYVDRYLASRPPETDPDRTPDGRRADLALSLPSDAQARPPRSRRLLQHRQWLGQVPRHSCRRQCRGDADLFRMARALRQHGGDDRGRGIYRRYRPRLHAIGRYPRLPVHPGPARLWRPASPHQHRHLRSSEG
jgi:hypothetical protein